MPIDKNIPNSKAIRDAKIFIYRFLSTINTSEMLSKFSSKEINDFIQEANDTTHQIAPYLKYDDLGISIYKLAIDMSTKNFALKNTQRLQQTLRFITSIFTPPKTTVDLIIDKLDLLIAEKFMKGVFSSYFGENSSTHFSEYRKTAFTKYTEDCLSKIPNFKDHFPLYKAATNLLDYLKDRKNEVILQDTFQMPDSPDDATKLAFQNLADKAFDLLKRQPIIKQEEKIHRIVACINNKFNLTWLNKNPKTLQESEAIYNDFISLTGTTLQSFIKKIPHDEANIKETGDLSISQLLGHKNYSENVSYYEKFNNLASELIYLQTFTNLTQKPRFLEIDENYLISKINNDAHFAKLIKGYLKEVYKAANTVYQNSLTSVKAAEVAPKNSSTWKVSSLIGTASKHLTSAVSFFTQQKTMEKNQSENKATAKIGDVKR